MAESSELIRKGPCPDCGSSDARAEYSDGHAFCYRCREHTRSSTEPDKAGRHRRLANTDFIEGDYQPLIKRKIDEETCRKLGYRVGKNKAGHAVQVADYRDAEGVLVAQKVRGSDKGFTCIGSMKSAGLWAQNVWPTKGRRVVVTEGEIDALSVAQVFQLRWPVVSIPNGAQSAKKAIEANIEWLEGYEEVVLMFDMDEPGRKAAIECAPLFSPGRCKIAELSRKDANEMLVDGLVKELSQAVFNARTYRPDGIVSLDDISERVLEEATVGRPWFDDRLTEATFGRRLGEVYVFGAGTGVGKTDLFTQQIAYDINNGIPCGVLFLEQNVAETARRIAGKRAGKLFHVPDGSWSKADLESAWDDLRGTGNLHLYDCWGAMDWETIRGKIRYMVSSLGCEHVFLDHLTALAAAEDDERKALERIMAEAAGLANGLKFTLHMVSHLATPEGKSHEEGGRVAIRHFKGSRAIGFWAHGMFGLERDQQADDESARSRTLLRCLKDRYTGRATGQTFPLDYDRTTGLLQAAEGVPEGFQEESEDVPF